VAYCETAVLSGNSGSAAASDLSSLAAFSVRVLRGEVCGREGGFIATRGRRNRNKIAWINTRRSRRPRARFSDGG
jgi:hypothetical protein